MPPARRAISVVCAAREIVGGIVGGIVGAAVEVVRRSSAGPSSSGVAELPTPSATELALAVHRGTILGLQPDLGAADTRVPDLLLRREGHLAMYYAPLDPVSPGAQVILLGTTPTAEVLAHALRAARSSLDAGLPDSDVLRDSRAAALAPVRRQLVALLEDMALPDILGVDAAGLIDGRAVDLTWALRNPVSRDGGTYTGTGPHIGASEMLRNAVVVDLAGELARAPGAPVIPLGDAAGEALDLLVDLGAIPSERALPSVPDPAATNAVRMAHFREDEEALEQIRKRIRALLGV